MAMVTGRPNKVAMCYGSRQRLPYRYVLSRNRNVVTSIGIRSSVLRDTRYKIHKTFEGFPKGPMGVYTSQKGYCLIVSSSSGGYCLIISSSSLVSRGFSNNSSLPPPKKEKSNQQKGSKNTCLYSFDIPTEHPSIKNKHRGNICRR